MENHRVNASRLILGLTLALVGVGLVLDRTGAVSWIDRNLWPVLLIGLGAARLLEPRTRGPRKGLLLLSLGLWLLLVQRNVLALAESWSILLIILGLGVAVDALVGGRVRPNAPPPAGDGPDLNTPFQIGAVRNGRAIDRPLGSTPLVVLGITVALALTLTSNRHHDRLLSLLPESREGMRVMAVMGRSAHVDHAESFRGAQVTTVMGKSELDLREASMAPGEEASIDIVTVMGQTVIRTPEGWTIDTRSVPVMGEVRDRRMSRRLARPAEAPAGGNVAPKAEAPAGSGAPPRVVLRGVVVMGAIVIES